MSDDNWVPNMSTRILATVIACAVVAAVAWIGYRTMTGQSVSLHPSVPAVVAIVGDDNGDGTIDESETGWDCRTMGNRLCGATVTVAGDGTMRASCPDGAPLFSRDGSESVESLVCDYA